MLGAFWCGRFILVHTCTYHMLSKIIYLVLLFSIDVSFPPAKIGGSGKALVNFPYPVELPFIWFSFFRFIFLFF